MELEVPSVEAAIKAKIVEIAAQLGEDANDLQSDDIIPATGLIDSAGLIELIGWYEGHFDIHLEQKEINVENLGSLNAMANFVMNRKAAG